MFVPFPLTPQLVFISVPSSNDFLEAACLFQVQWLTHSSHVITARLTSHCLIDCTLNETCKKGGRFREIPLNNRGIPIYRKHALSFPITLPEKKTPTHYLCGHLCTIKFSSSVPLLRHLSFLPVFPHHAIVGVDDFIFILSSGKMIQFSPLSFLLVYGLGNFFNWQGIIVIDLDAFFQQDTHKQRTCQMKKGEKLPRTTVRASWRT